jgi:hypothetical protein
MIRCVESVPYYGRRKEEVMLTDTIANLETAIDKRDVAMVIIDPVSAFFKGLAPNNDVSVRRTLTKMVSHADARRYALFATRHLTKTASRTTLYRGSGSIAFSAVARSVFTIARNPSLPDSRILVPVKSNVADLPPPLAYRITEAKSDEFDSARIDWLGALGDSPEEIAAASRLHGGGKVVERAGELLCELLWDGPLPERVIRERAREAGISLIALRRAKRSLDIRSTRALFGHGCQWMWAFPEAAESAATPLTRAR